MTTEKEIIIEEREKEIFFKLLSLGALLIDDDDDNDYICEIWEIAGKTLKKFRKKCYKIKKDT